MTAPVNEVIKFKGSGSVDESPFLKATSFINSNTYPVNTAFSTTEDKGMLTDAHVANSCKQFDFCEIQRERL